MATPRYGTVKRVWAWRNAMRVLFNDGSSFRFPSQPPTHALSRVKLATGDLQRETVVIATAVAASVT